MGRTGLIWYILFTMVLFSFVLLPVVASSTQVHIIKYAVDNTTIINETTITYQWMSEHLPVYGDGVTHYYGQGPVFIDDPDPVVEEMLRWNPEEDTNVEEKDYGAVKGTNLMDLCNLVGGMSGGEEVRLTATDSFAKTFNYTNVYEYPARQGPMVVTWYKDGLYPDTGYENGMLLLFFADDTTNPWGIHAFGNFDWHESADSKYWYYYSGEAGERYPTTTGLTVKYLSEIKIFSDDPVPPPDADFMANTKTGRILNGNFETGVLSPWTGSGATVSGYTQRKDSYSVRLLAPASSTAWIQQDIDFTNIGSIYFWRHYFGGTNKYMQVLVDSTIIANYTETSTIANDYETIDVTSYGFTGNHTLKFRLVNTNPSGSFTIYLDNIEDYGPGMSGPAPLTIQFKDLSTQMEDPAHSSWLWDFYNNGTATSTLKNPQFTYTANGTYTVKLTATNTGGSDTAIKTGYITVGTVTPPPVAGFIAAPLSGTGPLSVSFTDTSTNSPTSWLWAYKNASLGWTQFATTQNPVFTFPAGTYDINLTVTNAGGSDDEIKTNYISVTGVILAPVAAFTSSTQSGVDPLTVHFTDQSANTPTSWRWAYMNDTAGWTQFATIQNPTFTFPAGIYSINLTATNAGGGDDEIKIDYISVTEPEYIDIDITGSIDSWPFTTGVNDDTSSVHLAGGTNSDSWSVAVRDGLDGGKPPATAGKLAEWGGGSYIPSGKFLENPIQVQAGGGSYLPVSGSDQSILTGTAPTTFDHALPLRQVIEETDPALDGTHAYRIVITFTASIT